MLDDAIDQRRHFLELFLLIAVLSFLTAFLSAHVHELQLPWWVDGLIVGAIGVVVLGYLSRTNLFSFIGEFQVDVPLGYDEDADSFFAAPPSTSLDITHPINRAWQNHLAPRIGDGASSQALTADDDVIYDLVEYGILAVWSRRFSSGWDVEITHTRPTGRAIRTHDQPSIQVTEEDIRSAFFHNRLLRSPDAGGDDTEEESHQSVEPMPDIGECEFEAPPNTEIKCDSERGDKPTIHIEMENKYVKVVIQSTSRMWGRGHLLQQTLEPSELIQLIEEGGISHEIMMEWQEHLTHWILGLEVAVTPNRFRVFHPRWEAHLRWAEHLVECIGEACDYPVHLARPENVE